MSKSVSKNIGRGLLVAILSIGMVGGTAYTDSAMAAASSADGKNKNKGDRFPGCCGAPVQGQGALNKGGNGGNGGGGNGGGGGGSEDQF